MLPNAPWVRTSRLMRFRSLAVRWELMGLPCARMHVRESFSSPKWTRLPSSSSPSTART